MEHHVGSVWLLVVSTPLMFACSSQSVTEPTSEPAAGLKSSSATVAPASFSGYVHDVNKSRFQIGQNTVLEVNGAELQRWRGSLGAFALDPTNGWTMAILDSTSPRGPYILDESTHAQRVKAYFVNAGLPADQISGVQSTFLSGVSILSAKDMSSSKPTTLESITAILERSLNGIRVVESYAWAKMKTSGDVEIESVFWPPIDAAIVSRAVAFASVMADASTRASYVSRLPGSGHREGGIVIHHGDSSIHGPPNAYVSFDVTVSTAGSAAMHHFDENGAEFRLPHEQVSPSQQTPKR